MEILNDFNDFLKEHGFGSHFCNCCLDSDNLVDYGIMGIGPLADLFDKNKD